jgi:signal transduction histidine kinase
MAGSRWRRSRGVRVRTTAAATVVVAVALVIGAALLVVQERRALTRDVTTTARLRAQDVGGLLSSTIPSTLNVPSNDQSLVQVVDLSNGAVVSATSNIEGEPRLWTAVPPTGGFIARSVARIPVGESSYRIVAHTVQAPKGRFVIYAAASLTPVQQSTRALIRLLAIGLPVLLALVAVVTSVVTGWALRPVERIRREVAGIGDRELHRRVPEPGTGDEIDRLSNTMNAMLARIENARERQRRFVADASHELRSPLTAIRSQLEVDLAHPEHAEWRQREQDVLDETARLQRLVDDLLFLAQSDTNSLPTRRSPVDLDDLVLDETRPLRARGRVTVDLTHVSGGQVLGDADQLRRVLRNLLDNAESHAATLVRVSVQENDTSVELAITDDGPGVPPDQRSAVFERFTRLDNARARRDGGTGLGLPIARDIVEHHGGTLTLPETASGTTFVMTLPAANGPPDDVDGHA